VNANLEWKTGPVSGDNWIAVCDALKLTVESPTYAELMEDVGLTLNDLFLDLLHSNELERFLRDRGWTLARPMPSRTDENVRFDVPFIPAMISNGQTRELH
jgi:hypothetical protein